MASQLPDKLNEYLLHLEQPNNDVLLEMQSLAREREFPIIGQQCGRVISILAKAIGARRVFEMGSGYGYSMVWFALALGDDAEITHTDMDEANTAMAKEFAEKAGVSNKCRFLSGDATELLASEAGPFDAILIDIDKKDYPLALQIAAEKVRVGGLIFAHNTIWSGRVADETQDDPATKGIQMYNFRASTHPQLLTFLNPVDDGLSVSLKVS
jgi:predicted O-methyltransferase YrrM